MERSIVGIVPARGGSKGLRNKNLLPIQGEPLVARTVRIARESGVLATVVLSTDSPQIADAGEQAGAEIINRPVELAGDEAPMSSVIEHALQVTRDRGSTFTHVMLLQPTSPLRTAEDIRGAVRRLDDSAGRAVVSVCPAEHNPMLANTLPEDGSMAGFIRPEVARMNRQQMPTYYRLNGAIYLSDVDFFRAEGSFIAEGAFAYVMPTDRSVDIDDELDLATVEALLALHGLDR